MKVVLMDAPRPSLLPKVAHKYNSELQPQHRKEGNTTVDKIKSKSHGTITTKAN